MFMPVYAAFAAALVFYAILPVLGAFFVRSSWRSFRRAVALAASLPSPAELDYGPQDQGTEDNGGAKPGRRARIRGELEALGPKGELWVRSKEGSIVLDLSGVVLHTLHSEGRSDGDVLMETTRWEAMSVLQPGLKVYAVGEVAIRGARIFLDCRGKDGLVILHDGEHEGLTEAAIRAGRHQNEYWNSLSKGSMSVGVLVMALITIVILPEKPPALISSMVLSMAFAPVLPLLPPGLAAFLFYRRQWKLAREYRIRRDIDEYRGLGQARVLAWKTRARIHTLVSMAAFALALGLNGWLVVIVLRGIL